MFKDYSSLKSLNYTTVLMSMKIHHKESLNWYQLQEMQVFAMSYIQSLRMWDLTMKQNGSTGEPMKSDDGTYLTKGANC